MLRGAAAGDFGVPPAEPAPLQTPGRTWALAVSGPPSPRTPLTALPAASACSGHHGHPRALCCRPGGGAGQVQGATRAAVPTRALARAGAGPPRAPAAARAPPSSRGRMWAGSGREAGASWRGGSPGCTGACPAPGWLPVRTWTQQAATPRDAVDSHSAPGPAALGVRHRRAPRFALRFKTRGTLGCDLLAR